MRANKSRLSDSTFDINLAPFLDIIVAIVPLLLLSVVFVEIKMIETPVPQVVQNVIQKEEENQNPEVKVKLVVSKKEGMTLKLDNRGSVTDIVVPNRDGQLDLAALNEKAREIKNQFPKVFKLGLSPEPDVAFNELVQVMDSLRKSSTTNTKFSFVDETTGERVETDLMFPNVTFANVLPGE